MKSKILCSLSVVALSVQVQAAIYSTDFESFDPGSNVTDGTNAGFGWTSNDDSTLTPVLNWGAPVATLGSQAAAIGYYDPTISPVPTQPTIDLTHAYGEPIITAATGYGTHLALDFSILDSSTAQPNRDTFGISLTATGGAEIFKMLFTPTVISGTNTWNVNYTVGGTGSTSLGHFETLIDPSTDLRSTGVDTFGLVFTPKDATSANYSLTMLINGSSTTRTGTIAMAPGTVVDKFSALWTPTNLASPGDNYLLVDNIVLVPETSTSLLLCAAGVSLAFRRRRA